MGDDDEKIVKLSQDKATPPTKNKKQSKEQTKNINDSHLECFVLN